MVALSLLLTRRIFLKFSLASVIGQMNAWSYSGVSDPTHWAELSADYHTCGDGQRQSPIDLDIIKAVEKPITFNYRPIAINLLNNGRTIRQTGDDGCTLTFNNKIYQLLQFHFHTPSEHTHNEQHYPMELHLVHRHHPTGELAVVGIWIQPGKEQLELTTLSKYLPQQPGGLSKASTVVNPENLLPKNHSLVQYSGSLTTPPCSEGVIWLMMTNPIDASAQQIATFHQLLGDNARPLQRLPLRNIGQ
ncbi:MAG: carbonic anhydrase family protein [Leptolyngbya sp. SIO3F4]|nr:carbonic anhydrase family protein [Leptolyngbya sp. SIO3F4]